MVIMRRKEPYHGVAMLLVLQFRIDRDPAAGGFPVTIGPVAVLDRQFPGFRFQPEEILQDQFETVFSV